MPHWIQLLVYLTVVAVILYVSWGAINKLENSKLEGKELTYLFFICVVYAITLPRFKDYSYVLLIVPTYYILTRALFRRYYPPLLGLTLFAPIAYILLKDFLFGLIAYHSLYIAYITWALYLIRIYSDKGNA